MRPVALLAAAFIVVSGCAAPPVAGPGPTRAPAIWPLLGTEAPDPDAVRRRPVIVRVPNDVGARPQSGFAQSDIIMELLAEGGITRYALVFHSREADSIGPIRSARLSDLHYTPMLRGILAHVGAQATVLQRVRDAARGGAFVDIDQFEHAAAFDRISTRQAPQNVYTSTKRIREAAAAKGGDDKVDVPALRFGAPPASGKPAASFRIPYVAQQSVTYEYVAERTAYRRTQNSRPTTDDATKAEVYPVNVVVIKTEITEVPGIVEDELGSLSLEIRSTGSGPVVILRDGQRFDGTWSRQGNDMYRFADASGAAIPLRPGLTWMHVVPTSFDLGN